MRGSTASPSDSCARNSATNRQAISLLCDGQLQPRLRAHRLWLDAEDRVSATFYAVGVPATYLIGRDGVLRWKRVGPLAHDEPALNAALQKALAEPAS